MIDISKIDYSPLDRPDILMYLFHPRPEWGGSPALEDAEDHLIPMEEDVVIGARFHKAGRSDPIILFFHGNGEIVSDYDDLGHLYRQMNINFLPVDYRGYGRSTGRPTITFMMRDAHVIFDYVRGRLKEKGYGGPLIIMGRSLGSASALELAFHYKDEVEGLIIESGFATVEPLLELLGVRLDAAGGGGTEGLSNVERIRRYDKPTLIIHAEYDHIIPYSDGQALHEASTAADKTLLTVAGADHNSIFQVGMSEYMAAVGALVEKVR
jgi:pimeloyl-ACP methyl ester carboxylesterase